MNSKIYRQADSRWGSLPYPTKRYSFAGNGCGCCACLHVIIELEKYKNWTPKDLRPYMVQQGFATYGNGTTWAGITKTLQHYGFEVINHPTMQHVFNTLEKRKHKLGVILFRGGSKGGVTWTTGGHYVAYTDYKMIGNKHYFYCSLSLNFFLRLRMSRIFHNFVYGKINHIYQRHRYLYLLFYQLN